METWKISKFAKFTIAGIVDAIDFFMPPVIGSLYDVFATYISIKLWGKAGYFALWEILDLTDRADAFIPTIVATGIISEFTKK